MKAVMEPGAGQSEGGVLIAPRCVAEIAADIDIEAVKNPILSAILAQVKNGEMNSGRSFNNFVS